MATFLLVPGAMHPAWCWHRVVPLLEAAGHKAVALDLLGTGEDRSIAPRDVTLVLWADYVAEAVRAAEAPVLLAGHSRGGVVISEAAERAPDALAGLIYVTAVLPIPGKSLVETSGTGSELAPVLDADDCIIPLAPDLAKACFYNRCSPEDAAAAIAGLFPEPFASVSTPSTITPERWGRVPRAFVECTDDKALTLENQRRMQATAPCDPVITIDADHSPFLCAPEALADAMLAIADRLAPGG